MKHLMKMLVDELKDAEMLYDYACDAKCHGKDDLMNFYISRAEQRIKMFDEDNALITKHVEAAKKAGTATDGIWDCLYEFYIDDKNELLMKIKSFGK